MRSSCKSAPSYEAMKEEVEAIRSSVKNSGASKVYYTSIGFLPTTSCFSSRTHTDGDSSKNTSGHKIFSTGDSFGQQTLIGELVPYPQYMNCSLVNKPLFLHQLVSEVSQ